MSSVDYITSGTGGGGGGAPGFGGSGGGRGGGGVACPGDVALEVCCE